MTELVVKLPDELAQRAKNAGLLSDSAIQRLLEKAMRREAGRKLLDEARRIRAADIPPMNMDEIQAEVDAVRGEREEGLDFSASFIAGSSIVTDARVVDCGCAQ